MIQTCVAQAIAHAIIIKTSVSFNFQKQNGIVTLIFTKEKICKCCRNEITLDCQFLIMVIRSNKWYYND